jgi:hypothetical protein
MCIIIIITLPAVAAHAAGGSGFRGPQPLAFIAANKEPLVLTLASFAVTKLAYVRLTKLFREQYLSEKGIDVRFRLSFAGSGVQVRRQLSRQLLLKALPHATSSQFWLQLQSPHPQPSQDAVSSANAAAPAGRPPCANAIYVALCHLMLPRLFAYPTRALLCCAVPLFFLSRRVQS